MGRKVYIDNKPLEEAKLSCFDVLRRQVFKLQAEEIDVVDSLGRITAVAVAARMSSCIIVLRLWMVSRFGPGTLSVLQKPLR